MTIITSANNRPSAPSSCPSSPGQLRLPTWHCGNFVFCQQRPLLMGILNVTPDSFSDGGQFADLPSALAHAARLRQDGADIIDVGGESTRPGSLELGDTEECARVLPVVEALAHEGYCVSIDSRHAAVVEACLAAGAAIINDITGFVDPAMVDLATNSTAGCVVMHMQGQPGTMQLAPRYTDVVAEVSAFLLQQASVLVNAGVAPERICLDPGPGFGKDFAQNLALLKATRYFATLNTPAGEAVGLPAFVSMAAWSRKRFVGQACAVEEAAKRVGGSVAVALWAASQGARVLRVHDVEPTAQALKVLALLTEPGVDNAGEA